MTTLTWASTPADQLLLSAARDMEDFLAELRRVDVDDDGWRASMSSKCKALNERLSGLHARLEDHVRGARSAIHELRSALTAYRQGLSEGATMPSLSELEASLTEHYDALVETLRSRRVAIPAELERALEADGDADRAPNLKRAAFHVAMGVACAALYQLVVDKRLALILLGTFVVFFGAVEILRRYSKSINDFWTDRVFGAVGRPQERYRVNSASYYMWGMALITLFAPKTIVCAALLVLAFGDPMASAVGYRVGLHRFGNGKSLGGTLAFFIVTSLAAGAYLAFFGGLSTPVWIGLAATMAGAGALAELVGGRIDDNLVIPVVAAAMGMFFLFAVGG